MYQVVTEYEQCNHQHGNDFASYDFGYTYDDYAKLKHAKDRYDDIINNHDKSIVNVFILDTTTDRIIKDANYFVV